MTTVHKIIFSIKIFFILVLLLVYFNPHFTESSPIYIMIHSMFIITIVIYIIYKVNPFNKNIKLDRLDCIYIIIVCLILLKTINIKTLYNAFSLFKNNIKNNTYNKVTS